MGVTRKCGNQVPVRLATWTLLGLAGWLPGAPRLVAQTSGNIGYSGQGGGSGKAGAEAIEQKARVVQDTPPTNTSMFVDAAVLMNVKADEYVAVFGLAQEGATVQEAHDRMTVQVRQFTDSLKALHVRENDIHVDFVTQVKIYRYDVHEQVAQEKLSGFELKENVSIHFVERDLIDPLVDAAALAKIYDLIKVDYVVTDIAAKEKTLLAEAAGVLKEKVAEDEKLLGIKVEPPAEIYAQHTAIHYPTELYDSYTAASEEAVSRPRNWNDFTVVEARKGKTLFYNGLDGSGFDKVIHPVLLEPMVQFTIYLKVKYEVAR